MAECTCKFVAPGEAMDNRGCEVHTKPRYACDRCACIDYRPPRAPSSTKGGFHWPTCVCGHVAQEHN